MRTDLNTMLMWPFPIGTRAQDQAASLVSLSHAWAGRWRAYPCVGAHDYSLGVKQYWPKSVAHSLIIVEHDMLPTARALNELVECSEPICIVAYRLRSKDAQQAHRVLDPDGEEESIIGHKRYRWIGQGDTHADLWGLGCVRVRGTEPWPLGNHPAEWHMLDTVLSYKLGPAHVHWPEIAHRSGLHMPTRTGELVSIPA